jgi:two-component system response regulator TctD
MGVIGGPAGSLPLDEAALAGRRGEEQPMRILVVEDDPDLGDAIQRRLRRDGYAVDLLTDGRTADEVLRYQSYEVVVLDIGLPSMDGFAVLSALRRRGDRTPVLMLTARSDIEDRVTALDVGADDYLAKPFDFRELDARCRALMRRTQGLASGVTTIGKLTFDRGAKIARLDDMQLNLPNREYRLLEIFVGNLGRVLSKDQIASQLFDFDDEAGANAIEIYVGRLRRKLGDALKIKTLRGLGYVAEVGGQDAG